MGSPLDKLPKLESEGARNLRDIVSRCQTQAQRIVAKAAADGEISRSAKVRLAVYQDIVKEYGSITKPMDGVLKRVLTVAAKLGNQEAKSEFGSDVVKFNEARLARYWEYVAPANKKSLAAVMTDSMSDRAVRQLQQAYVETARDAAVQGLNANQTQSAIQLAWDKVAGNEDAFRFVDRGGKVWSNSSYLQMLTRTNTQRVSRDSFIDSLAFSGMKFSRISDDSPIEDEDEVCARWAGVIIQVAGSDSGLPTYADALADGMFHPNCRHRLGYVSPEEVEAEIGG